MAAVTFDEKILAAKSIICDIEGTTSSISFVKDVLYTYVQKHLEEYLKAHWSEDATKTVVAALREQADEDKKAEVEGVVPIPAEDSEDIIPEIVKNVEWQMSSDRKVGALKTLQGLVWAQGYKDGTIKGHVYEDVVKSLEQWTEGGRKVYVYSSGSVDAQKLLFEHSEHGDLVKYFTGYYDTKIGAKQEKDSYAAILKNIEASAEDALFLTDVIAEAKAAKEAGLNVVVLERPGNAEISEDDRKDFTVVKSFAEIPFSAEKAETEEANGNAKRKIDETVAEEETDEAQPPSKVAKVNEDKKSADAEKPEDAPVAAESMDTEMTDGATATTKTVEDDKPSTEAMVEDEKKEVAEEKKSDDEKTEDKPEEKIEEKTEAAEKKEPESATKEEEKMEVDAEEIAVEEKKKEENKTEEVVAAAEEKVDASKAEDKVEPVVESSDNKKEDETKKDAPEANDKTEAKPEETVTTATAEESKKVESVEIVKPAEETKGEEEEVATTTTSESVAAEVVTEAKEETDSAVTSSEESKKSDTAKVEESTTVAAEEVSTTTSDAKENGKHENGKETNGKEESRVPENGNHDEKADSDKENDKASSNVESEATPATNGDNTSDKNDSAATIPTTETAEELKAKKAIETAEATPTPPVEAES
ncbi:enolase-phosphatase E1 [Uranotaenia lowii]|uniref:enolase-phosphatase E1 n=1 Tax=Uranotaenia lowii TaxID=190385 RepID=UPI00247932D8|nr:enolase-phosphatase E1 [Uranotaenia lowii]